MMIEATPFIGKVSDNPALALRLLQALAGMQEHPATFGHISDSAGLLVHETTRLCECLTAFARLVRPRRWQAGGVSKSAEVNWNEGGTRSWCVTEFGVANDTAGRDLK